MSRKISRKDLESESENSKVAPEDADAPSGRTDSGTASRASKLPKPAKRGHKGPTNNSSTGKVIGVVADQTNWRRQLQQSRIKFDDEQKENYLKGLATHGLKGRAAKDVGVSLKTVCDHRTNDPDFDEKVGEALTEYRDLFVDHATTLALDGEITKKYNKNGVLIEEKHTYPIPLIQMELKRVEPEYRERQVIDLSTTIGGVLVAPASISPEEWVKREERLNLEKVAPGGDKDQDATVKKE